VSAYRKLKTQFSSRYRLRQALEAAGVEFEEVPVGQAERHLYGYHGDERPETATFIVRRSQIGNLSNDLGYHWNGQCYEEIVSDYDSRHRGCTAIRQAVKREYAVVTATEAARAKGYRVKRVDQANGQVQLVVTGRIS
jgi:hypothetical protein